MPIWFANFKNVDLDTKIIIVWRLYAKIKNGFTNFVRAKITPGALDDPVVH